MLVKPRLGSRRCSGIWPPSKPLMRTPERAVWPLPPRPACLPLPEPMPRPTRMRFLREPALSAISLSFIVLLPSLFVMAGHSRPKDGVASARLCPAIHVFDLGPKDVDARHKAGHDAKTIARRRCER